ncbi:MAG: trehalose-6-phosphate synthase [Thermoleophilia bacterium]|nr:trehalose-6-phosphate synthase [Thermoleophilia bacterium]
MPSRRKLIVVSNRAPVVFARAADGARVARRGGGGLVTALASLVSHHDVTWVASAISEEDRAVAAEAGGEALPETAHDGSPYRLRLVAHDPQAYDWYYNVVSNPILWFAQHYLWGLASAPDWDHGVRNAWQQGYCAVNRGFADVVLQELERDPEVAVFFHDYHLYVAPRLVREQAPWATLSHFVHVPWPQPDYWRVLPGPIRRAVHEGLLANDVVSFHTERWGANFLRGCLELTDAEADLASREVRIGERTVAVRACPISVDPDEFAALAESEAVREAEDALVASRPEVLVLRVDRTDPSKNVVRGFRAFEFYLDAHPEMHGRIQLLALLDPSRQDIPEYAEYLGAIQRAARAVNDRFQREGWRPLDLRIADDFPASVAAYKQFDVLLVNAIFDGMNLVAKEAPLVNTRDGVLVLSENAGAHEELGQWAISVNPFDVAGQADALHEATTMAGDERRRRLEGIRASVHRHDIAAWIAAQLAHLDEARARGARAVAVG